MDIKLFQRTQRELASTLNIIVDKYWNNEIDENELFNLIQKLYNNNERKFIKDNNYTTVLRQQCGKRRLEVVSKVLNIKEQIPSY